MPQKIKRMNKGFFLGAYLFCSIITLSVVLFEVLGSVKNPSEDQIEYLISNYQFVMAPIFMLYLTVMLIFHVLFHYQMWTSIYNESVDKTPEIALLFMCIPIYNIYWSFKFYPGFVDYYNRNISRYGLGLKMKPIENAAFTTFPIIALLAILFRIISRIFPLLTFVQGLLTFFGFVLLLIIVSKTCDAVNVLVDALEKNSPAVS